MKTALLFALNRYGSVWLPSSKIFLDLITLNLVCTFSDFRRVSLFYKKLSVYWVLSCLEVTNFSKLTIMATKRPGDDSNGNGHAAGNGDAPEAKKTKDVSNWAFKTGNMRNI